MARVISRSLTPKQTNGYLYYVRLKTQQGAFYKLGFTSMNSVHERFAFKGNGDEGLIDRVLCFVYFEDAYEIEYSLHNHFDHKRAFYKYSNDQDMPLCKNGQS